MSWCMSEHVDAAHTATLGMARCRLNAEQSQTVAGVQARRPWPSGLTRRGMVLTHRGRDHRGTVPTVTLLDHRGMVLVIVERPGRADAQTEGKAGSQA